MLAKLLERNVEKRPPSVTLQGRILFLTEDPALIRSQLAGQDLDWDPSIPLRDDISTDEITPGWVCYHYDETLGQYPYVGLECRGEHPIGRGDAVFVESDDLHRFIAGPDEPLGFMCAVLDKELRFTVHGEQELVLFDDDTGRVRSKEHWGSYAEQVK